MALAIGLMTGTSLDGLDVALCDIEGSFLTTKIKLLDYLCVPIDATLKDKIKRACDEGSSNNRLLCSLDFELGYFYLDGVNQLLKKHHLKYEDIAFIASHGQTVYHLPKPDSDEFASTMQIGQPAIMAHHTGIKVISNFRVMDMAAGGEGAPLVPYSDYLLYHQKDRSIALQNIGGIGNVTYLEKGASIDELSAFDTGPGNMMIDEAMMQLFKLDYDKSGLHASKGKIINEMFEELSNHNYFDLKPPKSTGREMFGKQFALELLSKYQDADPYDIIFTLTKFTAYSIYRSYQDHLKSIDQIVLSGGGAHNLTLIKLLEEYFGKIIFTQEELGFDSDAKEAVAFVILGNETLHRHFNNVKSATGANRSVVLGMIC